MLSYQTVQTIIQLGRMILDILIIWILLFYTIKIVRNNSRTTQIFKGIVLVIIVQALANYFGLVAVSWLAGTIVTYGFLAVIIIFQPELRSLLERIGKSSVFSRITTLSGNERQYLVDAVVHATMNLSQNRIGALITIEQNQSLNDYIKTGIKMNSLVTSDLIQTIFVPTTPLHDGAVIIQGDRIACASAYFPPSTAELPTRFGARHRAAIGISEITDSITIVISEKSGRVSIAEEGQLSLVTQSALRAFLEKVILHDVVDVPHKQRADVKVGQGNEPELTIIHAEPIKDAKNQDTEKPLRWYHKEEKPSIEPSSKPIPSTEVNKVISENKPFEEGITKPKPKTVWWPIKKKAKPVLTLSEEKPSPSLVKEQATKPIEKKEPVLETPKPLEIKPVEKKAEVIEPAKPLVSKPVEKKIEIIETAKPSIDKVDETFKPVAKSKWWQFSNKPKPVETKEIQAVSDKPLEKLDNINETPKRATSKSEQNALPITAPEVVKSNEDKKLSTSPNEELPLVETEKPKRQYRKKETVVEDKPLESKTETVDIKETPKVTLEYSVESESLFEDLSREESKKGGDK